MSGLARGRIGGARLWARALSLSLVWVCNGESGTVSNHRLVYRMHTIHFIPNTSLYPPLTQKGACLSRLTFDGALSSSGGSISSSPLVAPSGDGQCPSCTLPPVTRTCSTLTPCSVWREGNHNTILQHEHHHINVKITPPSPSLPSQHQASSLCLIPLPVPRLPSSLSSPVG